MRKIILAAAVLSVLTAPASAQLKLNVNANDPVTGLAPADWEQLVGHILNTQALVGDPGVLMVSSLPVSVTVTCDKWEIVGPNVYKSVQGNPAELKPFSVTYVKTKDFDGYCKQGVIGHYGIGKTIVGKLTSSDGSFTEATTILFSGDDRNK